ncbi:MAG: isopentenyl-diphosphate Delta-isomerase [candidate division KSB1 bacterium]|nr:isopentenyl-diphosphate Delta-isomerase [candidate division KSB1 bacterium]
MDEQVILVDRDDRQIGVEEKLKAHREGKLHRAFSIFVFNKKREMLLQKRAAHKYHSGGLWTNACCSHPRPGEPIALAAARRLQEEMGFDCALKKAFHFHYEARLDHQLVENEFDHVFVGQYDGPVRPNPDEVMEYRWLSIQKIKEELQHSPENYTVWFRLALMRTLSFVTPHENTR